MATEIKKPVALEPNHAGNDYYLSKTIAELNAVLAKLSKVADGMGLRINPSTNKLELGTVDKSYLTIGPNATVETSQAADGSGNGVITVGQGSLTVGAGCRLENVRLKINKQTGMFTLECVDESTFGQLAPLTTGAWNTMGSSNSIASNVTLSDRATLNASVISYSATGLMSLRHVVDTSDYSGMEHLNIGGYNVIGSNNTLASNIKIGDNVEIGAGSSIGSGAKIGDNTRLQGGAVVNGMGLVYEGENDKRGEFTLRSSTNTMRVYVRTPLNRRMGIFFDPFREISEFPGITFGDRDKVERAFLPFGFDGESVLRDIMEIKSKLGLD